MPDDADLVRRARAAIAAGDAAVAQRAAAELWARYEQHAVVASRRVARGAEADDVLGHLGLRFTKWVYHGHEDPRNMVGLISQMARYAAADVTRVEAGEAPTVEDVAVLGGTSDGELDAILARDELERLLHVLSDRDRVIIDRMLEDAPDAEVARELGIEPNNLHQIRFRALKRMREEADQGESGS
jgi:DNA-directed RNA polymerase specialized sigma24 family protein